MTLFTRNLRLKRVLHQPLGLRFLSIPTVMIRSQSPLVVRAAWSEEVKYPKKSFVRRLRDEHGKAYENDMVILEEVPFSASNEPLASISVPRRCNRLNIEASNNVQIEAEDKLEVVNDFQVKSTNGNVAIKSTTRANYIKVIAGGGLEFKSAVEGLKIELKSGQGVSAKRLHAKDINLAGKQNVSIRSLYVERANIHIENGNGHLDTVQGNLNLKVDSGDAIVESLSGQFSIEAAKGNGTVHLEQSESNAVNSIKVGKQAQVYLSRDALPIVISGKVKVNVSDPDVRYENNHIELLTPSESEGAGQLIVEGDSTSSVSIRSWIESAIAKAQKRIEEKDLEQTAKLGK